MQVIIDGCKREYEIDGEEEIKRISKLPCMVFERTYRDDNGSFKRKKYDFPLFMKYTREIKTTKNGSPLPIEEIKISRDKIKSRLNPAFECPMNWLEECLDKIQNISSENSLPTYDFFIKMSGEGNRRQMSKIMSLVEGYDAHIKKIKSTYSEDENIGLITIIEKVEEIIDELQKIKIRNTITYNRLIEVALGLSKEIGSSNSRKYDPSKHPRKILNLLYKTDKERFLSNFAPKSDQNCTINF